MNTVDKLMALLTTELKELKQEILDAIEKIDFKQESGLLSINNQLCLDKEQLEISRQELELNNKELRLSKKHLELEIAEIKALNNEMSLNNTQLQLSNNELKSDNTGLRAENKQLMINYNAYINEPSQSSINILERFL